MSLPESLVGQSALTDRQLEALRSYVGVALGEVRFRDAASRGAKSVTVGSYFRTVQQARENVRRSLVTLLIGLWLGVVIPDDVRWLLDLVGAGDRELGEEERERFVAVLRTLVQRIVMQSCDLSHLGCLRPRFGIAQVGPLGWPSSSGLPLRLLTSLNIFYFLVTVS